MGQDVITGIDFPNTISLYASERSPSAINIKLNSVRGAVMLEMKSWENVSEDDPVPPSQGTLMLMQGGEQSSIADMDFSSQAYLDWSANEPTPIGDTYDRRFSTYDRETVGLIRDGEYHGIGPGEAKVAVVSQDWGGGVVYSEPVTITGGFPTEEDISVADMRASKPDDYTVKLEYDVSSTISWGANVDVQFAVTEASDEAIFNETETINVPGSTRYGNENITTFEKTMQISNVGIQELFFCVAVV